MSSCLLGGGLQGAVCVRVGHADSGENAGLQHLFIGLLLDLLDQMSQHDIIGVRVLKLFARCGPRARIAERANGVLAGFRIVTADAVQAIAVKADSAVGAVKTAVAALPMDQRQKDRVLRALREVSVAREEYQDHMVL